MASLQQKRAARGASPLADTAAADLPSRAPMLLAALAFGTGTLLGAHAWRPATLWISAFIVVVAAVMVFLWNSSRAAEAANDSYSHSMGEAVAAQQEWVTDAAQRRSRVRPAGSPAIFIPAPPVSFGDIPSSPHAHRTSDFAASSSSLWSKVRAFLFPGFSLRATPSLPWRQTLAAWLALASLTLLGALAIQLHGIDRALPPDTAQFLGEDVEVTAHVVREGYVRPGGFGGQRQVVDVETEILGHYGVHVPLVTGIRASISERKRDMEAGKPMHLYQYGERLHFFGKVREPRNYGNPGAFDYRAWLAGRDITLTAAAPVAETTVLAPLSAPSSVTDRIAHSIEAIRQRLHRAIISKIHELWPPDQAGLLDAMVIGEDAFLDRDERVNFQRSGTYHVLVVSGMNVAILSFVVFWVLRRLRASDLLASILTLALAIAFAFLTAAGASIWRATLMLAIYLATRLLYRQSSQLNALGTAALGLMIVDPTILLDPGFQLTFLAVFAIAGIGLPILQRTTEPYRRGLRQLHAIGYDAALPAKVTQFRLDLRLLCDRLQRALPSRLVAPALRLRIVRAAITASAGFILGLADVLFISALMQAALALPMAWYFHRATVLGMPANALVVPLTEVLMPAACTAMALGFVAPALASLPALLTRWCLQGITGTVHFLGRLRPADLRVATPNLWVAIAAALTFALALLLARHPRLRVRFVGLYLLALAALWIALIPPHRDWHPGTLEVTAIDVGQGDSILVITPQGRTLLLDAGGSPSLSGFDTGEDVVAPYLWSRGITHLDAVAVSHGHADHLGGMTAILHAFHPAVLWIAAAPQTDLLQQLVTEAHSRGIMVTEQTAGNQFNFGGAHFSVLAPEPRIQRNGDITGDINGDIRSDINDESLVIKAAYGATSVLLPGDAEHAEESRVAQRDPSATLLKVAHHGSKTSTTPELLAATHPQLAVISVGLHNSYGHPRPEVLERLQTAHIRTWRTDLHGAVTFLLDGKTSSVQSATESPTR